MIFKIFPGVTPLPPFQRVRWGPNCSPTPPFQRVSWGPNCWGPQACQQLVKGSRIQKGWKPLFYTVIVANYNSLFMSTYLVNIAVATDAWSNKKEAQHIRHLLTMALTGPNRLLRRRRSIYTFLRRPEKPERPEKYLDTPVSNSSWKKKVFVRVSMARQPDECRTFRRSGVFCHNVIKSDPSKQNPAGVLLVKGENINAHPFGSLQNSNNVNVYQIV